MKAFVVFKNGCCIDAGKIVAVTPTRAIINGHERLIGSFVWYEQVGAYLDSTDDYSEYGPRLEVSETPSEVCELIQKALGNDVSFTSAT